MDQTQAYLQQLSGTTGMAFIPDAMALVGELEGYQVTIEVNGFTYYLCFSVRKDGMLPDQFLFDQLTNCSKLVKSASVQGNRLVLPLNALLRKTFEEQLVPTINSVVEILKANGYKNACAICGAEKEDVKPYEMGGRVQMACSDCVANASANPSVQTAQYSAQPGVQFDAQAAAQYNSQYGAQQQFYNQSGFQTEASQLAENTTMGAIGALLGSLVGVVVIIILGQLGYVAAISGVVMGFCTLKGYEKMAKSLSKKGVIISVVIMLIMVYVAERLDWAISFYNELKEYGYTFGECFGYLHTFLAELEATGDFMGSLGMLYLFTALGAGAVIKSVLKTVK